MEKVVQKRRLTKEEMKSIVTGGVAMSDVAMYKRINKMIFNGELTRVSTGQYEFSSKKRFIYSNPSNQLVRIKKDLEKSFKSTKFILYELSILNEFIAGSVKERKIIIEAEKKIANGIYTYLKEKGYKDVLLNPNEEEFQKYGGEIIIKTLVSKSPIDKKFHETTIEKLVVDLVTDKTLNMLMDERTAKKIVEIILKDYSLKYDSIKNYAKRRHAWDKFMGEIPEEQKYLFN